MSWWGNWREGDHWGDLGVDGWIILGRICEEKGVYSVLVVKPEGKRPLGDLGVDGWIILAWICVEKGVYRVLVGETGRKETTGET